MSFTKKLTAILLVLMLTFALIPNMLFADNEISVTINGQAVAFPDGQGAELIGGRTLVPVRGVFETLGFDVEWDNDTRTAILANDDYELRITIDRGIFTVNGASLTLDVPAQLIGGRTMVPIRLPLEAVGFSVGWDEATRTVLITALEEEPEPEPTPTPALTPKPEPTFTPITGKEMMSKLGMGINIGNTLEAHAGGALDENYNSGAVQWLRDNHMQSMFQWGESAIEPWHFEAIAQMGFDHVRIPVTWEIHLDANGKIYDEWIDHVQEVVDWALAAGLPVVLNTHHERKRPDSLKVLIDKGDTAGAEAWITNIWSQVAERFKYYPETLIFETMNEPYRAYRGGWIWDWSTGSGVLDTALARRINHFNNFARNVIRSSGGFNDKRVVMATALGADPEAVPHYVHPTNDPYTMLGIFFYNHERFFNNITNALNAGVPIYIKEIAPILHIDSPQGQVGSVTEADAVKWIRDNFGRFAGRGIPTAYWNHEASVQDNGWQIFSRSSGEWNMPLVNALFAAHGRTAGTVMPIPPPPFPHELSLVQNPYGVFFFVYRADAQYGTTPTNARVLNAAERLVIEYTGDIWSFSFAVLNHYPQHEWIQFDDNHTRVTREQGKIIFDIRELNIVHELLFAAWQDDWAEQITRVYFN
jgi:hypothetical protein